MRSTSESPASMSTPGVAVRQRGGGGGRRGGGGSSSRSGAETPRAGGYRRDAGGAGIEERGAGTVQCDALVPILPEMEVSLHLPRGRHSHRRSTRETRDGAAGVRAGGARAAVVRELPAGPNAEVVAALARFAAGEADETGLLLWGTPGAGKTHLLRATVRRSGCAASRPRSCRNRRRSKPPTSTRWRRRRWSPSTASTRRRAARRPSVHAVQRAQGRRRAPGRRQPAAAGRPAVARGRAHPAGLGPGLRSVPLADARQAGGAGRLRAGAAASRWATTSSATCSRTAAAT